MSARLSGLLASASVEVSSSGSDVGLLADHFPAGTGVSITFLPGDNYRHNVETAAALRRAGYNPVPHIAAREMTSRQALADFLARARGEADISRILLIAGDVVSARGPFKSTRDVAQAACSRRTELPASVLPAIPRGIPISNCRMRLLA